MKNIVILLIMTLVTSCLFEESKTSHSSNNVIKDEMNINVYERPKLIKGSCITFNRHTRPIATTVQPVIESFYLFVSDEIHIYPTRSVSSARKVVEFPSDSLLNDSLLEVFSEWSGFKLDTNLTNIYYDDKIYSWEFDDTQRRIVYGYILKGCDPEDYYRELNELMTNHVSLENYVTNDLNISSNYNKVDWTYLDNTFLAENPELNNESSIKSIDMSEIEFCGSIGGCSTPPTVVQDVVIKFIEFKNKTYKYYVDDKLSHLGGGPYVPSHSYSIFVENIGRVYSNKVFVRRDIKFTWPPQIDTIQYTSKWDYSDSLKNIVLSQEVGLPLSYGSSIFDGL